MKTQTKKCTQCGIEKSLSEFHKDVRRPDGIRGCCKSCCKRRALASRKARTLLIVPVEEKMCSKCREVLPAGCFNKGPSTPDGLQRMCRSCYKIYDKERRLKKLVEDPDYDIDSSLRHRHGINLKTYYEMERQQGSKCAICATTDAGTLKSAHKSKGRFCVDHNHGTGKIRGLLCSNCNLGIGFLGDTLEGVEAAAAYLRKYNNG